ncbi:MAG: YitT family protein [Erysipelotrichaceae bacterium]|nr:YitT family protein [Erysipelotrichaceae bacterium]
MKRIDRVKKKVNNFMYDHYHLKRALHETNGFLCGAAAAFLYAFSFVCFVTPSTSSFFANEDFNIVTGGVSGLSQNIALIVSMFGGNLSPITLQAIGYTCFNIPLLIFAFFKIGKRFSIQTAINIILSSAFLMIIPQWGVVDAVIKSPVMSYVTTDGMYHSFIIVRALFAAICTGFASAIAFKGDISCGGIDIITYYYSMRKSTSVGKYTILFNSIIICSYSLLLIMGNPSANFGVAVISLLVSSIYLFIVSLIIDMIHLRNKKVQIEFVTDNPSLGEVLIANFPHGATMSKGEGVYSGATRYVIWMVVSSFETQRVVTLARRADPHVFITVTSLVQVYGNFFIKPIG